MSPPIACENVQNEGRILLAIQAIQKNQIKSVRAAAAVYNIPRSTLQARMNGTRARRDTTPNSRKLTDLEEQTITKHLLDLDSRGFPPRLSIARDMANKLLAARGGSPVGIKWPENFVHRSPVLKMQFNRKYDYRRAQNEDPETIKKWFELVRNTIVKYGISDDDIFNFDETGFMMGVISTAKVITGSERRHRPKAIQPGNREWATVIQGVNARGWAIPPYVIFKGQCLLEAWFSNETPRGLEIGLSDNGWTTNKNGFEWLQHFDKHTRTLTKGTHRLLILDGHESHESIEFQDYCKENNIITLCMPAHSSHLLQPLDVGCFSPLKRRYGYHVETLMRNAVNHITKVEFLPCFVQAFQETFTAQNIQSGFRGAGLLPLDPEVVISKLDIRPITPPNPPQAAPQPVAWESMTPRNTAEFTSQLSFINDRLINHPESSPTTLQDAVSQLAKGAALVAHSAVILEARIVELENANKLATQRKKRQRRRIRHQGALSIQEGIDIINQRQLEAQIMQETRLAGSRSRSQMAQQRRCGRCRETGHRIQTCPLGRQNT